MDVDPALLLPAGLQWNNLITSKETATVEAQMQLALSYQIILITFLTVIIITSIIMIGAEAVC